ncbi:hypothetical protein ACHHYP_08339 [Achlya hypogyna]|uniref:Cytochrome P450 n=1 Tax=Achlya hypogyna TaxID=1202772 RepID=A0A1V9ZKS8_ACHHY|nr:hypothetical protein ACHHYP_08339 [Achlya hypogyna]
MGLMEMAALAMPTTFYGCAASVVLIATLLLTAYFIHVLVILPYFTPLKALPGPPPSSIVFGNAQELSAFSWDEMNPFPSVHLTWLKQYGPAYHCRILGTERVTIGDPEAIKHIYITNDKIYPRHILSRSLLRSFTGGIGLLSSEDPIHASQRKMLNPHFATTKLKSFVDVFQQHASIFTDQMCSVSDTNTPVSIYDVMTRLSFDIIGLAAFGYDFGAQFYRSTDIMEAYEDLNMTPRFFITFGMAYVPGFEEWPLAVLRKRKKARELLFKVVNDVIERKLSAPPSSARDLLDLMLDSSGHKLTAEEAKVHVMTFLFAGHETTSNSLCWVFTMLAQHPDVEQRVAAECRGVSGRGPLTWDDLADLPYTTAVIHETMRLYPAVMNLSTRECQRDDVVPLANGKSITIYKGTQVYVSVAANNRNPTYWSHPDDFLPERFLEGSELYQADKALRGGRSVSYIFTPFSIGPKACIGTRFALAEMQIVLATVLSKVSFELHATADVNAKITGVTVKPKNLQMTVPSSLIAWLAYALIVRPRFHPLNALPGPPPSSLILGNGKELTVFAWDDTNPFPGIQGKWLRQYGTAYHVRVLGTERVRHAPFTSLSLIRRIMLSDPDGLKHILVTNAANYPRHPIARAHNASFTGGAGLLSTEGTEHVGQRKMLNPHFSYANLKAFVSIFQRHATIFADRLASVADNSAAVLNVYEWTTKLSFDIIGVAAFGCEFNTQGNRSNEVLAAFEALNTVPSLLTVFGNAYVPGFEHLPLPTLLRRKAAKQVLFRVVNGVIARKLEAPVSTSRDLLDLMLEPSATGHQITPEEARTHVLTFLFAGHETTSNTLTWVLAMLARNPDVERRVVDECCRVMSHGDLVWEHLAELKYLTAVIHETLRLNPTVNNLVLSCAKDDTLPLADQKPVFVPAGSQIVFNFGATQRNPKYWTRSDEFLPERFLEGSELFEADKALRNGRSSTFFFLPFSTGAKNCIGSRFALAEMQVVLASTLTKYEFRLHKTADIHPKFTGVTLKPKHLAMTVSRRVSQREA